MQILLPILIRIIAFLFIFIAAQEATEAQGMILAAVFCLMFLDTSLLIRKGSGFLNYLKNDPTNEKG